MAEMPQLRAGGASQFRLLEANLNSFIAVTGSSLNLRYNTRTSFDHRDRDSCAVRPKYLGHADFSAQQSTEHILSSLLCRRDALDRALVHIPARYRPLCDHASLQLDFDVHACGQIQPCQSFDCFVGRLNNIYQALMRTNLKLLTRIFINKWRAHHGKLIDLRGQGHRA